MVQVDRLGRAQAVAPADASYQPTDAQIAWHLARFIEEVRAIPADPVVLHHQWLKAYDFATDRGALALNDYARERDPFAKVGSEISVDVSSVIRASPDSFSCCLEQGSPRRPAPVAGHQALTRWPGQ